MKHHTRYEFDNRDAGQMYEYMEARIEAMKGRILQLEQENQTLRWQQFDLPSTNSSRLSHSN